MSAALSFVLSVIGTIANYIRGNAVLCAGFVIVGVNILFWVLDKVKKLLI